MASLEAQRASLPSFTATQEEEFVPIKAKILEQRNLFCAAMATGVSDARSLFAPHDEFELKMMVKDNTSLQVVHFLHFCWCYLCAIPSPGVALPLIFASFVLHCSRPLCDSLLT